MKSSLGDLLLIFRRKILESVKKEGLKNDLTLSQVEILHFIGHSGKKTMKNIADYLKITPPSATLMVEEMEKKGLVKRVNDKVDHRVVWITLSTKTKKTFASICKRKELIFKEMILKLSQKEQKDLERIIKIIIN
jgi:MarR family 2-MHQ and catechol resistance regulon transcriptional repressor